MLRDYILELDLIISILNISFVRLDVSFIVPKLKSNWVNIPVVPETKIQIEMDVIFVDFQKEIV